MQHLFTKLIEFTFLKSGEKLVTISTFINKYKPFEKDRTVFEHLVLGKRFGNSTPTKKI